MYMNNETSYNKLILMDIRNSVHQDDSYVQQIMDVTGSVTKKKDIFKYLPYIMEKVEIIKKTRNISNEECKLLTIQLTKKMVSMSDNEESIHNDIVAFIDENIVVFIDVLVKASKNEYEFNKRLTLFQRIFNWVMFSRIMSIFKTGTEIALL